MANYPTGISNLGNTAVILELTDDNPINTSNYPNFASGYVRQIGISVINCAVDDYVQYNSLTQAPFTQGGITYSWLESENILFVQDPLP